MKTAFVRSVVAGWVGGLVGNATLGLAFSSPWIQAALYNPAWQSRLFLEVTPTRNVALSVAGLIFLSALHGVLYQVARPVLPGRNWLARGAAWGSIVWATYWLFQEWFVYVTLLQEPLPLALLELAILLIGTVIEGLVVAWLIEGRSRGDGAGNRHAGVNPQP